MGRKNPDLTGREHQQNQSEGREAAGGERKEQRSKESLKRQEVNDMQ